MNPGPLNLILNYLGTRVINILFQEKRAHHKLPYYSCVIAKKYMPDMPMGNVYYIQSRTCITRMNKSKVRVLITFEVSFKKSGLVSCKNIIKHVIFPHINLLLHSNH